MRRKNRKKKQKVEQQTSTIGRIIDMPMEEFKEELVRQKVNIGVMNNLILNLEGSYAELKSRKDSSAPDYLSISNILDEDFINDGAMLNCFGITAVEMILIKRITYKLTRDK